MFVGFLVSCRDNTESRTSQTVLLVYNDAALGSMDNRRLGAAIRVAYELARIEATSASSQYGSRVR